MKRKLITLKNWREKNCTKLNLYNYERWKNGIILELNYMKLAKL